MKREEKMWLTSCDTCWRKTFCRREGNAALMKRGRLMGHWTIIDGRTCPIDDAIEYYNDYHGGL